MQVDCAQLAEQAPRVQAPTSETNENKSLTADAVAELMRSPKLKVIDSRFAMRDKSRQVDKVDYSLVPGQNCPESDDSDLRRLLNIVWNDKNLSHRYQPRFIRNNRMVLTAILFLFALLFPAYLFRKATPVKGPNNHD